MITLNGIKLRNRLITSSSLLGYGVPPSIRTPYGTSPFARFVPLERFGAVTTRTLTLEPRRGHFSLRRNWSVQEIPDLLAQYTRVLRRTDSGWINAFGWSNVGIHAYFHDYYPLTHRLNRILSVGGFSGEDFRKLIQHAEAHAYGGLAAIEFNVSCTNVNYEFDRILHEVLDVVPRSPWPVLLKLSADVNYIEYARLAEKSGVSGLVAINTVRGLRLDPSTGQPWLANGFGGLSGRAIKPIALRVVAELRDSGITLPIIASGGIRNLNDCREFLFAGADAFSLGSEVWLASYPGYLLAPLRAMQIRRLLHQVERLG